jgi:hypothetical protein
MKKCVDYWSVLLQPNSNVASPNYVRQTASNLYNIPQKEDGHQDEVTIFFQLLFLLENKLHHYLFFQNC